MGPVDHQMIAAVMAAVTSLFLISGLPPLAPWRTAPRRVVVVGYLCALALVLIEIGVWLSAGSR